MKFLKLLASLAASFSAAAIGSLATTPNIPTWYAGLEKPFFNPPNWVFGPVWTLLYLLIGISLFLIWTKPYKFSKTSLYMMFAVQIVLNTLWSVVFFGLHQKLLGFVIIVSLFASIILMIISYKPVSKTASLVLIPYALWVGFATCLNLAIALIN